MSFQPVVVLVETQGPANIGQVARSVAAFGLDSFRLVAPRCAQDESTLMWACYGKRVLHSVETFPDLSSALADCEIAIALSRREGRTRHRHYTLSAVAETLLPSHPNNQRVAFVFGNEESGLSLEHLKMCQFSAEIPVLAEDGSLNLAHAVSITLYELLGRARGSNTLPGPKNVHEQQADAVDIASLLERCSETLAKVGYPRHRSSVEEEMVKLSSLISRSALEHWEFKLLMGMLKQINYRLDHPR